MLRLVRRTQPRSDSIVRIAAAPHFLVPSQVRHCYGARMRNVASFVHGGTRATAIPSLCFALLLSAGTLAPASGAADKTETKSALETDPAGWVDIMPSASLNGWY